MGTRRQTNRKVVSLKAVLALSLGGLQFVAVLTVVLSTYFTSERAILRQLGSTMHEVNFSIISQVTSFLDPARNTLNTTRRLAESDLLDISDDAALEKHFFQQIQVAPQLAGLYFADASGRFVYVMRTDEPQRYRSKFVPPFDQGAAHHPASFIWRNDRFVIEDRARDLSDQYEARTRPWYVNVTASREPVWTNPYIFFTTRRPGITYAVPILAADGEIRGILGMDIEIDAISDFMRNLWSDQQGATLILNETGEVIAHPELNLIKNDADQNYPELVRVDEINDDIANAAFGAMPDVPDLGRGETIFSNFEFDGERYVSTLVSIVEPDVRWMIGIYVRADNFIGEIRKDRYRGIWIALAIALLTSFIGLKIADRINRPLRVFADRTRRVSAGQGGPLEALSSPYRELDATSQAFTKEIKRRQKFENAYGRTFELASRGMAQIDPNSGGFLRTNAQLGALLGYDQDVLSRMNLDDLMGQNGLSFVDDILKALLEDSEYIDEHRFARKDGSPIWLRMNAILIRDERGDPDHVVIIFDDIDEQKRTEAFAAQLKRDVSHTARVNQMGEMASSLAHELNQPLSAISYNVDAAMLSLNSPDDADDELKEILGDIDRQSFRAGEIIRALRGIVRKDRGRMLPFDLNDLVRQSVSLIEAEAKQHGVTIKQQRTDTLQVVGNRTQIAQVVVNLLKNAIEAISESGQGKGSIHISFSAEGDEVTTQISDSGPGVGATELFQPYDTLKQGGMGLGLSICRTIIQDHGGQIWNTPDVARGAQFCFSLKAASADDKDFAQ
ncbi:PAS domain S-box protein [Epibacterium sp. SM1969]|uniref:histidine kinase n=1 Tax=Tritonibacter aquimaris TaxID=2663379 RepID=A0A844B0Z0_9RHOB|nr:PAS domain S-box protein [Tritonibacter aquimaris]